MTIADVKLCTGCTACSVICPQKCISMKTDGEGFIKPVVDYAKCINCGLCFKNCPQECSYNLNEKRDEAYAFVNLNKSELEKSSSGGAFISLAKYILSKGGVVFGAAYDSNFFVRTVAIERVEDLYRLQGSKYVQSDIGDGYIEVKQYLKRNRLVLFSGTPCQIAGLYAALKEERENINLITVELLCHGVPSNKLFQTYLKYAERKYGKICEYTFRDKEKWGWRNWGSISYLRKDKIKKRYFPVASDYFYSLYFKENIFMESCYNCKYAVLPRLADITLGDFWVGEQLLSDFNLKEGVSLVINNNCRADKLFYKIIDENIKTKKILLQKIIPFNLTIIKPVERPKSRDDIYKQVEKYGFVYTADKYCSIQKILPRIARYVPRRLKRMLKKFLRREKK